MSEPRKCVVCRKPLKSIQPQQKTCSARCRKDNKNILSRLRYDAGGFRRARRYYERTSAARSIYYFKNKDAIRAKRLQRYLENPAPFLARVRRWKSKNPERLRESRRRSYLRHRQDRLAYSNARNAKIRAIVKSAHELGLI